MRLKTLTLNRFKRHQSLTVDFHPGSNAIMGPNYAGKSTILEAVFVLLWGNKGGSVPADQLISDDAKDFELIGTFTNGLTIRRTSKDSSITREGEEPYARGHTAVNKAIEEILGMDRNTFMKVFASKQGNPQKLLEMEGMELQRFVEGCIRLGNLDEIVKAAGRHANNHKVSMQAFESLLLDPLDYERVKNELLDFKAEAEGLVAVTEYATGSIDVMRRQRDALQAELSEAVHHNKLVDHFTAARKTVEAFGDIQEPVLACPQDLERKIENLSKIELLWQIHAKSVSDGNSLKSQLAKVQSNAPVTPEDLLETAILEQSVESLLASVRSTEADIKAIEELFRNARCPTCKRNFELTDDELEVKRVQLEALKEEYSRGSKLLSDARQSLQDATQHNALQEKRRRLCELYEGQLADARQRLQDWVLEPEPQISLREAAQLMSDYRRELADLTTANTRAMDHWNQYLTAKAKLEALSDPGPSKAYDQIHDELQEVTKSLDAISQDLQKDLARLGHLKTCIGTNEGILERHKSAVEKVEEKSNMVQKYSNIKSVLSDNRNKIVSDAMAVVFAATSDFVSSCTDGDISEVLFHESSLAYKEGDRIRYVGSASGAQKTLIGVGMKLGLSRLVMTPFDCLLLDEVSADMDDEISMRCMLALSSFGQSIFVSHRQMDVADQVIVLER